MAGYDMKELAKDMDIAIKELREIRKELIATRRMIQREQRLRFPLIGTEPEEIAKSVKEATSEMIRDMASEEAEE